MVKITEKYNEFISNHKNQLISSSVPQIFWRTLAIKLSNQLFDAHKAFKIYEIEDNVNTSVQKKVVVNCNRINFDDEDHIYLIDHAWTFRIHEARKYLTEIPGLTDRMGKLMKLIDDTDNVVEKILVEMWKYCQTYSIPSFSEAEDRVPIWYIMDEFGSAIQHSEDPNFRIVPFFYLNDGLAYSLLFPIKDCSNGDEVTRDFVETYVPNQIFKSVLLIPWIPSSFLTHSFEPLPYDENYFVTGRSLESLPETEISPIEVSENHIFKVFTQYIYILQYLDHPQFEIVNNQNEADILWFTDHFKTYRELSDNSPNTFINQFPYESVISSKDLLSIISYHSIPEGTFCDMDTLETLPGWLPTTYNLTTELPQFVSYFQHREKNGFDNYWICKPFNLARGLDTTITNNLNCILKLSLSGPKIAQKYVSDPVLYNRPEVGDVKFDIRYVLLLKSVKPLKVYAYRNFFLRFANKQFELTDFDNYEKHFTVMNYSEEVMFCHIKCDRFVEEFDKQYPEQEWVETEKDIFRMLRKVFESAVKYDPPGGIAHNPRSRALYAADLMLSWKHNDRGSKIMQPKLLEINWMPDCQRACEYYPDFYNNIFSLLFLNNFNETVFKEL